MIKLQYFYLFEPKPYHKHILNVENNTVETIFNKGI